MSGHAGPAGETKAFDFAAYKESTLSKIAPDQKALINGLEEKATKENDKAAKKELLNQLIAVCEKNKLDAIACTYSKQIAQADNTAEAWIKTGDNYSETYGSDSISDSLRIYLAQNAQKCYQEALERKPEDTDTKIKLAGTYMDGQQPMSGVSILLDIVRKDSNNIKAQFILGRYGIVSGQYDKAVLRLTRVTEIDPKNTDAWFLLAQAYSGLGKKDKAIESFEKCKKLVNDPQISAEIDNYIEKIKNS